MRMPPANHLLVLRFAAMRLALVPLGNTAVTLRLTLVSLGNTAVSLRLALIPLRNTAGQTPCLFQTTS